MFCLRSNSKGLKRFRSFLQRILFVFLFEIGGRFIEFIHFIFNLGGFLFWNEVNIIIFSAFDVPFVLQRENFHFL